MATPNITMDPITRIEGQLAIQAVAENGVITDAWAVSKLFRGIEVVLKGRAPEDAFYVTQRMCGVCPTSHGHASSMAVEAADPTFELPNGARIVRNILEGAEWLHSHIFHFYALAALDYVNPAKALQANIADTYALAMEKGIGTADFGAVQARLAKLVEGGDLSIFTNGWWGIDPVANPQAADELYNPDIPAELHLIGVSQYLQGLEMQGTAAQIIAIIGGKFPMPMTSVAGGTAWMPRSDKLDDCLFRLKTVAAFVNDHMVPFTLAIAPYYERELTYGQGVKNYLSWGAFDRPTRRIEDRYLPGGFIKESAGLTTVNRPMVEHVTEDVTHSWYDQESGQRFTESETNIVSDGDFNQDLDGQYSWGKAPRYQRDAMEAGPLARILVAYMDQSSQSNSAVREVVDNALATLGTDDPTVLMSTLGRVAARNLETAVAAKWAEEWIEELVVELRTGRAEFWNSYSSSNGEGTGVWEAPRGALAHHVKTANGRITNYQIVTPSTWILSPRSDDGAPGPMEAALIGTPVRDIERPIEAARVVRSFDP
ncbi:MAG: nickel-dependent hydrogenase large subunit [Coriobacteriia bacterium]|nr:nickel-dependent hydrogenase large subunit [Coriobacteriia bacterium]